MTVSLDLSHVLSAFGFANWNLADIICVKQVPSVIPGVIQSRPTDNFLEIKTNIVLRTVLRRGALEFATQIHWIFCLPWAQPSLSKVEIWKLWANRRSFLISCSLFSRKRSGKWKSSWEELSYLWQKDKETDAGKERRSGLRAVWRWRCRTAVVVRGVYEWGAEVYQEAKSEGRSGVKSLEWGAGNTEVQGSQPEEQERHF